MGPNRAEYTRPATISAAPDQSRRTLGGLSHDFPTYEGEQDGERRKRQFQQAVDLVSLIGIPEGALGKAAGMGARAAGLGERLGAGGRMMELPDLPPVRAAAGDMVRGGSMYEAAPHGLRASEGSYQSAFREPPGSGKVDIPPDLDRYRIPGGHQLSGYESFSAQQNLLEPPVGRMAQPEFDPYTRQLGESQSVFGDRPPIDPHKWDAQMTEMEQPLRIHPDPWEHPAAGLSGQEGQPIQGTRRYLEPPRMTEIDGRTMQQNFSGGYTQTPYGPYSPYNETNDLARLRHGANQGAMQDARRYLAEKSAGKPLSITEQWASQPPPPDHPPAPGADNIDGMLNGYEEAMPGVQANLVGFDEMKLPDQNRMNNAGFGTDPSLTMPQQAETVPDFRTQTDLVAPQPLGPSDDPTLMEQQMPTANPGVGPWSDQNIQRTKDRLGLPRFTSNNPADILGPSNPPLKTPDDLRAALRTAPNPSIVLQNADPKLVSRILNELPDELQSEFFMNRGSW